jgi:hypothetical protein
MSIVRSDSSLLWKLERWRQERPSIPYDNSIPQITEGDEYSTLSITPKSATSKLVVEAVIIAANSVAPNAMTVALFQAATANALAASSFTAVAATAAETVNLRHIMASGTTLATTFRVRLAEIARELQP